MSEVNHPFIEIAQYVADGRPFSDALKTHIEDCCTCQAFITKLCVTESALHSLPKVNAGPELRPNVSRLITESQAELPKWHALPRVALLPILVLVFATIMTLALVPSGANTPLYVNIKDPLLVLPQTLGSGTPSGQMYLPKDALLAIASIIAAFLGGTGIYWAVSSLTPEQDKRITELGNRLSEGASQLLHFRHN